MTNTEILAEVMEDHDGYSESYDFDDSEYLEEVESEDWVQEGKYQYCQTVHFSTKHNVYIAVNHTRSGSYHSDWYYNEPDVSIVKKVTRQVTKTITEWVTV